MPVVRPQTSAFCSAVVGRAEACPGSAVLQLDVPDKPSPAAWWGILGHRFLEYCKTRGRDAALDYVREKFKRGVRMCEQIDVFALPWGESEVNLSHHPGLQEAHRIAYGSRQLPGWMFAGRADVLDLGLPTDDRAQREPRVHDYKFGPGPHDTDSDQLVGLAAAACDLVGWDGGAEVTAWAVLSTGELVPYARAVSAEELAAWRTRAQRVHLQVLSDRADYQADRKLPKFESGPHCGWCGLMGVCPATRK